MNHNPISNKLKHAKGLYLEAIQAGDLSAVERYTGDTYIQHSTGVADGRQGFTEFFREFHQRSPHRDIRIIRTIEEDNKVFLHVYQSINHGESQWVTADILAADAQDKLIEHWDVISPYIAPEDSLSGQEMVLAPDDANPHGVDSAVAVAGDAVDNVADSTEEKNDYQTLTHHKTMVRQFIYHAWQCHQSDKALALIDSQFVQYSPYIAQGLTGLQQAIDGKVFRYEFITQMLAQGDRVVTFGRCQFKGEPCAIVNIFRLQAGKIVAHWDVLETIPENTGNLGKF